MGQVYFGKLSNGSHGFFDDSVHAAAQIPKGAVKVDATTHQQLLTSQGTSGEIGVDASGNPEIVPWTASQLATNSTAAMKGQLAELDAFLPRALEDMWTATSFDTTKLPEVQQARLSRKQALRRQIASPETAS